MSAGISPILFQSASTEFLIKTEADNLRVQHILTQMNLNNASYSMYACSTIPGAGNTQIQEEFSDWIATEVVARDIQKLSPEKGRIKGFESTADLLGNACQGKTTQLSDKLKKALEGCYPGLISTMPYDFFQDINNVLSREEDTHPTDTNRFERLYFAHPEFRKVFACSSHSIFSSKETKCCELKKK